MGRHFAGVEKRPGGSVLNGVTRFRRGRKCVQAGAFRQGAVHVCFALRWWETVCSADGLKRRRSCPVGVTRWFGLGDLLRGAPVAVSDRVGWLGDGRGVCSQFRGRGGVLHLLPARKRLPIAKTPSVVCRTSRQPHTKQQSQRASAHQLDGGMRSGRKPASQNHSRAGTCQFGSAAKNPYPTPTLGAQIGRSLTGHPPRPAVGSSQGPRARCACTSTARVKKTPRCTTSLPPPGFSAHRAAQSVWRRARGRSV